MGRFKEAIDVLMGKKAAVIGQPFAAYQYINGQLVGIDDNKGSYISNGYEINDVIYSIINLITDKVSLPEWGVYKVKDEGSLKSYLGLMRRKDLSGEDFKKALQYKSEALELVNAGKLTELLTYPNETQTMQDLAAISAGYKLLTGDRYLWAETLQAGANAGKPQYLHILPSQEITIIADRSVMPISEAGYSIMGINQQFTKDQVLHDKYTNYDWDANGGHLYGMAPLKAALRRLGRNNNAVKTSDSMMQNGGLPGVLFMDDPRVLSGNFNLTDSSAQMAALKEKMKRGPDRAGEMAMSGYKMGFVPIGLSPVDLNIIESEKWDAKRFASVFGVPVQLIGDSDSSTYNNVKEAEKALTSRCAMPLLVSLRNHLNRKINDQWGYKGTGYFIDFDQTCFTEMQEDIKEKSTWVNTLKLLSPNEQRNLLGLETLEIPEADEPWISAQDGVPYSEWKMQEDDNGTNSDADLSGDK